MSTELISFQEITPRLFVCDKGTITIAGFFPIQPLPPEVVKRPNKYINPYPSFYDVCQCTVSGDEENRTTVRFSSHTWYPNCFIDFFFHNEDPRPNGKPDHNFGITGTGIPTSNLSCWFSFDIQTGVKNVVFKSGTIFGVLINYKLSL